MITDPAGPLKSVYNQAVIEHVGARRPGARPDTTLIGFHRRHSTLFCEDVPIPALVQAEGTPLYVYSAGVIRDRIGQFQRALRGGRHAVHYALKANSNLAIVRLVRSLGCGVDANSVGEIEVALRAGFRPAEIVFTGVGKTTSELARAVGLGLRTINAESAGEIARVDALARARGVRVPLAVRVNPDIEAGSHPHISTGRRASKFGVPLDDAAELCRSASKWPGISLVGLHVHIGSQIVDLEPLRRAAGAVAGLAADLRRDGVALQHLDVGGGLGISYEGSAAPTIPDYVDAVKSAVQSSGLALIVEPGRVVMAPAGVLLTSVVDVKPQDTGRVFAVLDAGMTELMRPALYSAYHRIEPVDTRGGDPILCDFVGPVCESSDVVACARRLPVPFVGDPFAVFDTGAYGFTMASNYNRRPLPAEVLVDGATWRVIRRRQTLDDLLALEL